MRLVTSVGSFPDPWGIMALEVKQWTDQTSWDAFIGSQVSGHYNQGWGWGELAQPLGGRISRYAILDGSEIRAAMSVVSNPIRRTGRDQLYVSRGPAMDRPDEESLLLCDDALSRLAAQRHAIVAKVEPYVAAGDRPWPGLLRNRGFTPLYPPSQPRSIWVLDLDRELDDLLARMKPKWRYNIRLAQKRGVEVRAGTERDAGAFYAMYSETARRDGFYIHGQSIYEEIFDTFWGLGQFELLLASYGALPIAAVTLIHLGRTVWYLYGASTNTHREVMAPHLLQWEAIKWAKARGAKVYDLRGVPDVPADGQEMYGVFRFKQGFGGRHVTLLEQYAKGYRQPLFGLWKGYWQGRYLAQAANRLRTGHPHRQWA